MSTQKKVGAMCTHKMNEETRNFEYLHFSTSLCDKTYFLSHVMLAITACINHPHQPFASPLISFHKEARLITLATSSKKCPCSQLNDPIQNPLIASSMHARMR